MIDDYINRISKNNVQKLKKDFEIYNLDFNLWTKEIETEIAWQQFIYFNYSKKIEIDENQINLELENLLSSNLTSNNKEVNLSEIEVFQDTKISNEVLIKKIKDEIKNNGFENTALKLSISESSSKKGNLGWINSRILSKIINDKIRILKPGEISEPIVQTNTILFLKLNSEKFLKSNEVDKVRLKKNLINQKQNELFNLFARSHLSKLKNNYLIQYR